MTRDNTLEVYLLLVSVKPHLSQKFATWHNLTPHEIEVYIRRKITQHMEQAQ
jgi:hypothetical protein